MSMQGSPRTRLSREKKVLGKKNRKKQLFNRENSFFRSYTGPKATWNLHKALF